MSQLCHPSHYLTQILRGTAQTDGSYQLVSTKPIACLAARIYRESIVLQMVRPGRALKRNIAVI